MRPILQPRAAYVIGHRAKDEPTRANGCRHTRATALLAPIPTRWASGAVTAASTSRGKGSGFEQPPTAGDKRFRRPCAAGPAIPFGDVPLVRGRSVSLTLPSLVQRGSRRPCRLAHRPGVWIAHIGDVDAPEVGRIAEGFRNCGERNRASLSLWFPSSSIGEQLGELGLVPARTMRATARTACCPSRLAMSREVTGLDGSLALCRRRSLSGRWMVVAVVELELSAIASGGLVEGPVRRSWCRRG
jgi:hypothetical protein